MSTKRAERVVVLGGGYAGTLAAVRLAGRARGRAEVTLVDAKTEFVQRVRLHQVAAGQSVAEPPYPKVLGRRVGFVAGKAERIDTERGVLELRDGAKRELGFDRLIYAVGSATDVSSTPGVAEHAHCVADRASARRLSHALAYAASSARVVVVGGGLTGIEAATEIAEAYPELKVQLLSSGAVGGWLSAPARTYLTRALNRLKIETIERARVTAADADRLWLADGSDVEFQTLIWCAGFQTSKLAAESGLATDADGRLEIDREMRSTSHPQIVGVGDAAATLVGGRPLRMCCHVAAPTSGRAADTVLAEIRGRTPKELHFGYVHQPLSLGRKDGLIQFVDREDAPRDRILTGRLAAFYKEAVSASPLVTVRMERIVPGSNVWPIKEPKRARLAGAAAVARGLPQTTAVRGPQDASDREAG